MSNLKVKDSTNTTNSPRNESLLSQQQSSQSATKRKRITKSFLKNLAEELLAQDVGFIPDKRYTRRNAEKRFIDDSVYEALNRAPETRKRKNETAQELSSRIGKAPLLTPVEEEKYFSQMNYMKYRFNKLRAKIDPENPDRELILEADRLLAHASKVRDLLIQSNLRLVISVTKKFVTPQMAFDDLFSDGVMALMQAVEKFDISRGYRFSTYAYYSISRSMYRFTKKLKKNLLTVDSLDFNTHDDKPSSELLPENTWNRLSDNLEEMITQLDDREQWIIRQRYSFDVVGAKTPTYKHLAEKLGVCNERVRQLEKRALSKLRDMQQAEKLNDLVEAAKI